MNALDPILSPAAVAKLLGVSKPTVWRLRRAGNFPAPISLSPGRVGFRASDIGEWLASRKTVGCKTNSDPTAPKSAPELTEAVAELERAGFPHNKAVAILVAFAHGLASGRGVGPDVARERLKNIHEGVAIQEAN